MGVSYRGERMIGNMPFSLFNGHKKEDRQKKKTIKFLEKGFWKILRERGEKNEDKSLAMKKMRG